MRGVRVRPIFPFVRSALEILAFGLALAVAAPAVGAQFGRWNARLDLLTHFALLWLGGALLAFGLSWASPSFARGWAIRLLAFVALIASADLILPDFISPAVAEPRAGAHRIKLIEFNAWGAHSDPDLVAAWIASQRADVAIVVEPTAALEREIRAETGLQTSMFEGAIIATRSAALKQRKNWETRFLPGTGFSNSWPSIYGFDGRPFTIFALHLQWPIPSRLRDSQYLHLKSLLDREDRTRTILAGDFNATQWSFRQRAAERGFGLERRDRAQPTWPARLARLHGVDFPLPLLPIDHVYAGALWRTVGVSRGPRLGSDHYPLVVTLEWEGPVGGDPRLWPGT